MNGVLAAACHDGKLHLMVLVDDPDPVKSIACVEAARARVLHARDVALQATPPQTGA